MFMAMVPVLENISRRVYCVSLETYVWIGFGIYFIRPDKRDNIILGSSLSNFHVEWIDGVTPDEVDAKSILSRLSGRLMRLMAKTF
jgi:hypothetical protein